MRTITRLSLVIATVMVAALAAAQEKREQKMEIARQRPTGILVKLSLGMLRAELALTDAQAAQIEKIQDAVHRQAEAMRKERAAQEEAKSNRVEGREGQESPLSNLATEAGEAIKALLNERQVIATESLGSHAESLVFAGIPLEIYDKLGLTAKQEAQLVEIGWQARSAAKLQSENGEQERRAARVGAEEAAKQVLSARQINMIVDYVSRPRHEGGRRSH